MWDNVPFQSTGCYCRTQEAHDRDNLYPGGHGVGGTISVPWQRHGFFCSRGGSNHGWKENEDWQFRYQFLYNNRHIDIVSSAADLYLLEAMAFDVANPRPKPVADIGNITGIVQNPKDVLALIGVRGDQTVNKWVEKYGEGANPAKMLSSLYGNYPDTLLIQVPINKSLAKIRNEAHELLSTGSTALGLILRDYMHYAAVGELGYHKEMVKGFDSDIGVFVSSQGWWDFICHAGGETAAKTASDIFRDKTLAKTKAWGSSYGGEKWAKATDMLRYYEKGRMGKKPFDAKMFADRMFSLQHNTGSILNKWQWGGGRARAAGYHVENMTKILDAHANSDFKRLSEVCSEQVFDMLLEYWTITNREFIRAGLEPVAFPPKSPHYASGSYKKKQKPLVSVVAGAPIVSTKASVLIAVGGKMFNTLVIPDEVVNVGKKVVHKEW